MGAMASQITSLTIVNSTVYPGADQRKHQSSASLTFVWGIHRWPVNSPHKGPVTRKMFPFDDVIIDCRHVILCPSNGPLSSDFARASFMPASSLLTDTWASRLLPNRVGIIKPFPVPFFGLFSMLSRDRLPVGYHVYIWQVSLQLACDDACQIWTWFAESVMIM